MLLLSLIFIISWNCLDTQLKSQQMDRAKRIWYLSPMRAAKGSGEPAHPRSLARTFAARSYKQWVKRNLQTESQIPSPSEWLGMRSWNLSWRNARRHKFAWLGPNYLIKIILKFRQKKAFTSLKHYWPSWICDDFNMLHICSRTWERNCLGAVHFSEKWSRLFIAIMTSDHSNLVRSSLKDSFLIP